MERYGGKKLVSLAVTAILGEYHMSRYGWIGIHGFNGLNEWQSKILGLGKHSLSTIFFNKNMPPIITITMCMHIAMHAAKKYSEGRVSKNLIEA